MGNPRITVQKLTVNQDVFICFVYLGKNAALKYLMSIHALYFIDLKKQDSDVTLK